MEEEDYLGHGLCRTANEIRRDTGLSRVRPPYGVGSFLARFADNSLVTLNRKTVEVAAQGKLMNFAAKSTSARPSPTVSKRSPRSTQRLSRESHGTVSGREVQQENESKGRWESLKRETDMVAAKGRAFSAAKGPHCATLPNTSNKVFAMIAARWPRPTLSQTDTGAHERLRQATPHTISCHDVARQRRTRGLPQQRPLWKSSIPRRVTRSRR